MTKMERFRLDEIERRLGDASADDLAAHAPADLRWLIDQLRRAERGLDMSVETLGAAIEAFAAARTSGGLRHQP